MTSWILLDDDDDYHNVKEDEEYPRRNMSDSSEAASQKWGWSQGHNEQSIIKYLMTTDYFK